MTQKCKGGEGEVKMRKGVWAAILALVLLGGGCCGHPGIFNRVETSLKTVQSFYEPLLNEDLSDERVHRAVVAADTTLLLAGELQKQWCPSSQGVQQLELQVQETGSLAQQVGLTPTGTIQSPESGTGGSNQP